MVLTNYGILLCNGETTTTDSAEITEYDVTQGVVLDALKAGALVVLKTLDAGQGVDEYSISYISAFAYNSSANETECYSSNSMRFTLNDPDEPLKFEENT